MGRGGMGEGEERGEGTTRMTCPTNFPVQWDAVFVTLYSAPNAMYCNFGNTNLICKGFIIFANVSNAFTMLF